MTRLTLRSGRMIEPYHTHFAHFLCYNYYYIVNCFTGTEINSKFEIVSLSRQTMTPLFGTPRPPSSVTCGNLILTQRLRISPGSRVLLTKIESRGRITQY